jgi:hypothetical protein
MEGEGKGRKGIGDKRRQEEVRGEKLGTEKSWAGR